MTNTKNCFQVDIPANDPDMEDLMALKRVKDAISKKKKQLKEKDWNNKHPSLVELVEKYRRGKIKVEGKTEEGKIKLDLERSKPNVEIDEKPLTRKVDVEIKVNEVKEPEVQPKLERNISRALSKAIAKKPEEQFNKALQQTEQAHDQVPIKMVNGRFF